MDSPAKAGTLVAAMELVVGVGAADETDCMFSSSKTVFLLGAVVMLKRHATVGLVVVV